MNISLKDHRFQPPEPHAQAKKPIMIVVKLSIPPRRIREQRATSRESRDRRRHHHLTHPLTGTRALQVLRRLPSRDARLSGRPIIEASMIAALIIVFREVIEAGLIVGIVLAVTTGIARRGRWVAAGIAAGVAGATLVAVSPTHSPVLWLVSVRKYSTQAFWLGCRDAILAQHLDGAAWP